MRKKRSIPDKFNAICTKYKASIEVIGIFCGLIILVLTFWSTLIAKDLLKLSQQQEYHKQLPIWDFEIVDSSSTIRIKSFYPDIKIQIVNPYFSNSIVPYFQKSLEPPKFELDLTSLNFELLQFYNKINPPDTSHSRGYKLSMDNFPIALNITYIQYGENRSVCGLFAIQYTVEQASPAPPQIKLKGVLFDHYGDESKILEELDVFTKNIKNDLTQEALQND